MIRNFIAILASTMVLLAHGVIYPTAAVVTAVDYDLDLVTVEKATGFVYEFYGVEDLCVGDVMAMLMYSNGTPETIADDIVISARYSGYTSADVTKVE